MPLTPPSQIAARQLTYFAQKHILLAGELEDNFAIELLEHAASVNVFTTNVAYAEQLAPHSDIHVQFGACYQPQTQIDMLVLYWPKAKAEAAYLLAMLTAAIGVGVEVVVVGENRSGVKSIEKMFASYGNITKFDSARRCSFYWGEVSATPAPFRLDDWYKNYTLTIDNSELTIRALPGVFSQNQLDVGTALLLKNLDDINGKVLDIGCGAGVIGAVLKTRNPTIDITMVDVSALAVASAQETLRYNGLEGNVLASNVYSEISASFDHIVSNPPFHSGLATEYGVTEKLLANAPNYLNNNGKLTVVANSFLHYSPIIEQAFGACLLTAKTNKFAIYQATKI